MLRWCSCSWINIGAPVPCVRAGRRNLCTTCVHTRTRDNASCANNEAGRHHRERAGMRICRLHAWTAIKSGGRPRRRGGTGERRARSNRSLRRKKWISYPRADEGEKETWGDRSASSRRRQRGPPLVVLTANKFFAARRRTARRLPLQDNEAA